MDIISLVDIIRGLVRPILSLLVGGTFVYLAVKVILPVEATATIIGVVFTFWFASRQMEKLLDKILEQLKREK